jgi:hypothetical protein
LRRAREIFRADAFAEDASGHLVGEATRHGGSTRADSS